MDYIVPALMGLALFIVFPAFIFYLFVRAVRNPGTRWWGIVTLLAILTCYCTTWAGIIGFILGSDATGSGKLETRYCEEFPNALRQTETLPDAFARMDEFSAGDDFQIREPDKNLRFRYVWLLGGCFLFAGANLMMFGPGRREKRHPADCIMMTVAALVVFLTGIWQIAWGNGYAYQASSFRKHLTGWHENVRPDAIRETNAELAARLDAGIVYDRKTKGAGNPLTDKQSFRWLYELDWLFRTLSGETVKGPFHFPEIEEDRGPHPPADEADRPGENAPGSDSGAESSAETPSAPEE